MPEAKGARTRPADDLVIAGLVPMSTVDWPDHLTATVFMQGCPWNCFYCHNQALIPARTPGQVAWEEVRALLRRRRGLLDGVVLTGGEALRQDALADAAREVIDMGFQVGLHTAGPYPRRLRDMIASGLVDWVGLDIKALPEHYGQVVGRANAAAKAWESLEVLIEAAGRGGPDFEVRTTVVPGDVTADDAVEQSPPAAQQGAHLLPRHLAGRAGGDEGLVVAVEAVPGAALQEDGRGQVVGPVDRAHGDEPGDHQVVSRAVVGALPRRRSGWGGLRASRQGGHGCSSRVLSSWHRVVGRRRRIIRRRPTTRRILRR